MNYKKLLKDIPISTTIMYLKVPKCKIDYIEIPQIIELTKNDEDIFYSTTMGTDRHIDDLVSNFINSDSVIIIAESEAKLKRAFYEYYQNYLSALRTELKFLEESIPNLIKTDFISDSQNNFPDDWK